MDEQELKSFQASNDVHGNGSKYVQDRDTVELARVGKKQVLKRRFGFLSMIGFACSLTITWEAMLVDFAVGLDNGGPAGLIYSYLLSWIGTVSVFIAMSELASMLPTAGGQYHWVSVLAPRPARRILSYITGWTTVISWVAAATAVAFFTGTLIQDMVQVNITSYDPKGWQGTLIMWGVILLSTIITTTFGKILPVLEVVILLLHILGFFGTMIPLAYHAGTKPSSANPGAIFTHFFDLGSWSTQTLSFFVGISGNATALLGMDGAIHMSEEVEKSSVNVPRSIIWATMLNGVLGFAMLITALLSVDNLEQLATSTSRYPFIEILISGFNSVGGATTIVALVMFMNFAANMAALSSAGRMMWSFARDRGLPGWQWLRKVDRRTSIPYNTIFTAAIAGALLGLINIGSTTAFNDLISLVLEGFYLSYLFATSLLLYRRMRGDILDPVRDSLLVPNGEDQPYTWGPWRVKGLLGTLNNIFAVVYLLVIGFFAFWPPSSQVTAANMNYSSLVLGAVLLGSLVWYMLRARKYYTGPVVEVEIS